MATVLITGVGGATGVGAIRSLHAETSHRVVGVDMNPAAAGIQLADAGTIVPAAADESWPDAMANVVERFDIDVVVPTVDEELAMLPSLSRALPANVPIVAPRQEVIDLSLDKYRTYERLHNAGHIVPCTWPATELDHVDSTAFPLIVKPRRGRGSRGVQRFDNKDDLTTYLGRTEHVRDELLCQEFIRGTEYTTSVVGTEDGQLLSIVPKEAIEKDGSTVVGATRRAPAVAASCQNIFETLDPAGPLNVQQLVDEDGTPYTIEINPRFSSTSCLTVAAGVNEFDLLIRDVLGESVERSDGYEADKYILRYDDHVFADAVDLDQLK